MEELSFRDILWHLVYARKIQNQLDIARSVHVVDFFVSRII